MSSLGGFGRLLALARESREQGNLFFYFPDAKERIKQQAAEVQQQLKAGKR